MIQIGTVNKTLSYLHHTYYHLVTINKSTRHLMKNILKAYYIR